MRHGSSPVARKAARKRWRKRPAGRYADQRRSSAARGIPFLLTFDQWWELWAPHWEKRGHLLMMCRTGDKGPHAVGNVRICTSGENARERHAARTL